MSNAHSDQQSQEVHFDVPNDPSGLSVPIHAIHMDPLDTSGETFGASQSRPTQNSSIKKPSNDSRRVHDDSSGTHKTATSGRHLWLYILAATGAIILIVLLSTLLTLLPSKNGSGPTSPTNSERLIQFSFLANQPAAASTNINTTVPHAADGNFYTYWEAAHSSGFFVIDLGEGSNLQVTRVSYAPKPGSEVEMRGGTFQASNNPAFNNTNTTTTARRLLAGENSFTSIIVDLFSIPLDQTPVAGEYTTAEITIVVSEPLRYLRYYMPSGAPSTSYPNMAELQIYAKTFEPSAPVSAPSSSSSSSTAAGADLYLSSSSTASSADLYSSSSSTASTESPPLPVTQVIATATGAGSASIAFVETDSTVTSCTATASTSFGAVSVVESSSFPFTPIIVTGLERGTNYTFTVYCNNTIGSSPPTTSNIITSWNFPSTPIISQVVFVSTESIAVSFIPGSANGADITSCTATSSPDFVTSTSSSPSLSPILVSGLQPDTNYTFTVNCTNSVGNSDSSVPSSLIITASVPSSPTNIEVTISSVDNATVSFTVGDANGFNITSCIAFAVSASLSSPLMAVGESPSFSPITITGLQFGTNYTFEVSCTNALGPSLLSSSPIITWNVPSTPTIINVIPSYTSATIEYSANGVAIQYCTATAQPGSISSGPVAYTTTGGMITLTNLNPETQYQFSLNCTNAFGDSPSANGPIATLIPNPDPVTDVIATATSTNSASIEFVLGSDHGYSISVCGAYTPDGIIAQSSSAPFTPIVASGLQRGTNYIFAVNCSNAYGSSVQSTSNLITTWDIPSPSVITNVIPSYRDVEVEVTLGANHGSAITDCNITATTPSSSITTTQTLTNPGPFATLTADNLEVSSEYNVSVVCINSVGSSGPSNVYGPITTLTPSLPSPPTDLTVTGSTGVGGEVSVDFILGAANGERFTSCTATAFSSPANVNLTRSVTSLSAPFHPIVFSDIYVSNYTFEVSCNNSIGSSDVSSVTFVLDVPSVSDVTAVVISGYTVYPAIFTVSWSMNDNGAPITNCSIYTIAQDGTPTVYSATSPVTVATMGTAQNVYYAFQVQCTNSVGQGPISAPSASVENCFIDTDIVSIYYSTAVQERWANIGNLEFQLFELNLPASSIHPDMQSQLECSQEQMNLNSWLNWFEFGRSSSSSIESESECVLTFASVMMKYLRAGDFALSSTEIGELYLDRVELLPHPVGKISSTRVTTIGFINPDGKIATYQLTPDHAVFTHPATTTTTTSTSDPINNVIPFDVSRWRESEGDFVNERGPWSQEFLKRADEVAEGELLWYWSGADVESDESRMERDGKVHRYRNHLILVEVISSNTTMMDVSVQNPILRQNRLVVNGIISSTCSMHAIESLKFVRSFPLTRVLFMIWPSIGRFGLDVTNVIMRSFEEEDFIALLTNVAAITRYVQSASLLLNFNSYPHLFQLYAQGIITLITIALAIVFINYTSTFKFIQMRVIDLLVPSGWASNRSDANSISAPTSTLTQSRLGATCATVGSPPRK